MLPTGIPDKGRVLTQLTLLLARLPRRAESPAQHRRRRRCGPPFAAQAATLAGRTMLVRKTTVVPIECVVRGYLAGSGWKEYRQRRHGLRHPAAGRAARERAAARADLHAGDQGRDAGTTRTSRSTQMADDRRQRRWPRSCERAASTSIAGPRSTPGRAASSSPTRSSSGAGCRTGELILIDEVLTPDSSRFWPADEYRPGGNPPSFDKQFVRDWLKTSGWDKNSPPPALPTDVVERTAAKYLEAFERLTA